MHARNASRGTALGSSILVADTHWSRLRGMLGRPEPGPGEGLLLEPCQAVHMYGMKYRLDIAFLGDGGRIVAVYHELEPGRVSGRHRDARRALELRAGTLAATGTKIGDTVAIGADDS